VLCKEPNITEVEGQLSRSDSLNPHQKLIFTKLELTRKMQRPSVSRSDVTEQHLQILAIKSLKDKVQDRNQWHSMVEVIRGRSGLW
jgi:hypothetical protein